MRLWMRGRRQLPTQLPPRQGGGRQPRSPWINKNTREKRWLYNGNSVGNCSFNNARLLWNVNWNKETFIGLSKSKIEICLYKTSWRWGTNGILCRWDAYYREFKHFLWIVRSDVLPHRMETGSETERFCCRYLVAYHLAIFVNDKELRALDIQIRLKQSMGSGWWTFHLRIVVHLHKNPSVPTGGLAASDADSVSQWDKYEHK